MLCTEYIFISYKLYVIIDTIVNSKIETHSDVTYTKIVYEIRKPVFYTTLLQQHVKPSILR